MKNFFLIVIIGFISAIVINMLMTDTIHSIDGGFEEMAFTRNENNTGPVHRLYAFSLADTLWKNMQQHADLLPHTKYGSTEVYYFVNPDKTSPIKLDLKNSANSAFDKGACVAYLKKDGMGKVSLQRFPF